MFKQSEEQQKKDFKFSVLDGSFFILMNSIAVNFLVPYIILLGARPVQIGMLETLPFLVSSIFMLFSHRLLKYFRSKKAIVVFFITLQSLIWVPIAFTHYLAKNSFIVWIVIFFYILEFSVAKLVHPIYTDWIRHIFYKGRFSRMLSKKNIFLQVFSLIPLIMIGTILDFVSVENTLLPFTFIFLFAGISRFISSRFLKKMSQTETKKELKREYTLHKKPIFKIFRKEVFKDKIFFNYLIFIFIMFFGIYFGTSYLKYFILDVLKFNYTKYVWFQVAFVIGNVFSLAYWGYISDRYGALRIIKSTVLFYPFFLLMHFYFAQISFGLLLFGQFFAGTIISGFMLAILTYMYQNVKLDFMNHMSFLFVFQAIAMVLGSLFGGLIVEHFESLYTPYYSVFLLFLITMVIRSFGVGFGVLKLKERKTTDINFVREVMFFRPFLYGVRGFVKVLSFEEKKFVKKRILEYKIKSKGIKINKEKFKEMVLGIEEKEKKIVEKINLFIRKKKK